MYNATAPINFPNELVSPEEKEQKSYGLNVAKAIYYHHNTHGSNLFISRARELEEIRDYIFGRQDTSQYKPLAGINPNTDDKEAFVKGIRWEIVSYATKRINIAVSKIANMKYNATCDAIDEKAMGIKNDIANKIRMLMAEKDFLSEMGVLEGLLPPDMSAEDIPTDNDSLQDYLSHTKLFAASLIEEAVKEHLSDNDYEEIKKEVAQDLIEAGVAAVATGLDENVMPFIKRFEIERLLLPKSRYQDFRDIKYWGYLDFISFSDFEKESQGQFTQTELEIIRDSARENTNYLSELSGYYEVDFNESVKTVPVIRFEWKTTDIETYAKKIDKFGNTKLYKKKNSYQGNGKNTKLQHKYTSVYEGVWALGTEYLYNYRRKHFTERSRGNMNETPLGLKIYAPNMKNHKLVSAGQQIIPILDDLQSYNIKIRHILASPFPNGAEINLNSLKSVGFEWGGQKMSPQNLLEFLFQKKILLTDRQPKQGALDKAVIEMDQGIQLQEYLGLIQNKLGELDEVLGMNAASVASQLGDRAGATTTQIQIQQSNLALDYLFHADRKIFLEVCKSLAILHCYSEKYGKPGRYNRIYGRIGSQMFKENLDLTEHDYSFDLEPYPSDQERNEFLETIRAMVSAGAISASEATMLRRITNLKKAEFELRRMEKRKAKEMKEAELQKIEANAQAQKESNLIATQGKQEELRLQAELIQLEGQEQRKTEKAKHSFKMKEIALKESLSGEYKTEQIKSQSQNSQNKQK